MKARWNTLRLRSLTTTPLRAIVMIAVIVVAVSSATVAFGAIGDGGTVTTCFSKATGTWRPIDLASGVKCKSGEQQLIFYTKEKVDSLLGSLNFLTQTQADARYLGIGAQAADSDQLDGMDSSEFLGASDQATDSAKLDGKDSSEFVTTNCIGFPHVRVDWHGCDLTGANLTGANLSVADLTNANLSVADLTNANLSLANLTGAILSHVSWAHTTCPDGTNSDDHGNTCDGHL